VGERARDRVLGRTIEQPLDLAAPPAELHARDIRVVDLVDDVVDLAAERVQRGDAVAFARRQELEREIEARAAARDFVAAIFDRRHVNREVYAMRAWPNHARRASAARTGRIPPRRACR